MDTEALFEGIGPVSESVAGAQTGNVVHENIKGVVCFL